jgi:hypothetical protein
MKWLRTVVAILACAAGSQAQAADQPVTIDYYSQQVLLHHKAEFGHFLQATHGDARLAAFQLAKSLFGDCHADVIGVDDNGVTKAGQQAYLDEKDAKSLLQGVAKAGLSTEVLAFALDLEERHPPPPDKWTRCDENIDGIYYRVYLSGDDWAYIKYFERRFEQGARHYNAVMRFAANSDRTSAELRSDGIEQFELLVGESDKIHLKDTKAAAALLDLKTQLEKRIEGTEPDYSGFVTLLGKIVNQAASETKEQEDSRAAAWEEQTAEFNRQQKAASCDTARWSAAMGSDVAQGFVLASCW